MSASLVVAYSSASLALPFRYAPLRSSSLNSTSEKAVCIFFASGLKWNSRAAKRLGALRHASLVRELAASRPTPCSLPARAMWAQKNRCAISFALLKTIKSHQYGKVTTWQSVNWHSPFPGEEFRLMVTLTVGSNVTLDRLRRSAGCAPVRVARSGVGRFASRSANSAAPSAHGGSWGKQK